MAVSSDVHDLDEAGQETFVKLIAESIAHLLGISADYVSVIVHNFLDDRRLLRMTHKFGGRRLTLTRRLQADLDVSYTVTTTAEHATNISDSLTSTVSTGIHTTLNTFIADDNTINVTVHNVSDFATPTVTVVVSTDATTDDSDKISTRVVIIISVCVALASLLCVCLCVLLWCWTCRASKRAV